MDSIDKINLHLTRLGMSGADLEREIGVSNSVYSQWNTKSTKPSKKNLIKVAKLFGVDVAELMPDVGQKENPAAVSSEAKDSVTKKIYDIVDSADDKKRMKILEILQVIDTMEG